VWWESSSIIANTIEASAATLTIAARDESLILTMFEYLCSLCRQRPTGQGAGRPIGQTLER